MEAGLHVYMAKPVAVDVPGCLRIGAVGKQATQKQRVFLVDYQIPTDPNNIKVHQAVREGKAGKLARMMTTGISGGRNDPPKTANIESRLQNLIWDNDIAIGGGLIVSYDIHAIDAAVWMIGQRPIAAMGCSRICPAESARRRLRCLLGRLRVRRRADPRAFQPTSAEPYPRRTELQDLQLQHPGVRRLLEQCALSRSAARSPWADR